MANQSNWNSEIPQLTRLIDQLVDVQDSGGILKEKGIRSKVDFLERALEAWRFLNRYPENQIPLDEFVQSKVFIDERRITFQRPTKLEERGTGTPQIMLQPRLLLFLLLYHRDRYAVYDIIERFIAKIRGKLDILDFKKTRTGVTRCFTNTRFAAHTLRDYGFLRFTQVEAYKTWVLSLTGFLVASRALDEGIEWEISRVEKLHNFDLHPDVRSAWLGLETFDRFVERLRKVCEPNIDVFGTFEDVLRKAYELLPGYWDIVRDHHRTQKERQAATTSRLEIIDRLPGMSDFYKEFSACVNVERLLRDV